MAGRHPAASGRQLLEWVNRVLDTDHVSMEQLADGVAYCQLAELVYGRFPLHKLCFDARREDDRAANLRVLADFLHRQQVDGVRINPAKLATGRLADHMELLQVWRAIVMSAAGATPVADAMYERRKQAAAQFDRTRGGTGIAKLASHLIPNRQPSPTKGFADDVRESHAPRARGAGSHAASAPFSEARDAAASSEATAVGGMGSQQMAQRLAEIQRRAQAGASLAAPTAPAAPAAPAPAAVGGAPAVPRSAAGGDSAAIPTPTSPAQVSARDARAEELAQLVQALEEDVQDSLYDLLDHTRHVQELQAEREFYFRMLRSIESICEIRGGDDPAAAQILRVLGEPDPFVSRGRP